MSQSIQTSDENAYQNIKKISDQRYKEISEMVAPFIEMTDKYGELVCKLTELLGNFKPKSRQDKIVRDMYNDIFDFLYEARELILAGKITVAFPLARRAFESQSLLAAFIQDEKIAIQWDSGKEFSNSEMREFHSKSKLKEDKEVMRDLYKFYTKGSHPNRGLIGVRFLGEGNQFTLGVIGAPDLILLSKHLIELTHLWFWYGACVMYFYSAEIQKHNYSLFEEYKLVSSKAPEVKEWLAEELNRLLEEYKSESLK
ncbi:MAG: hypothetical protein WA160_05700 [Pseudobdellovibrio sp.]